MFPCGKVSNSKKSGVLGSTEGTRERLKYTYIWFSRKAAWSGILFLCSSMKISGACVGLESVPFVADSCDVSRIPRK